MTDTIEFPLSEPLEGDDAPLLLLVRRGTLLEECWTEQYDAMTDNQKAEFAIALARISKAIMSGLNTEPIH